jgi:hypothetical protein
MTVATGGPAFPAPDAGQEHFNQRSAYMGMTLRDYFAAKAMQGFAAAVTDFPSVDLMATTAYRWADAMLKARQQ